MFGELIQGTDIEMITVDYTANHISRSKIMTQDFENIEYFVSSSKSSLNLVKVS